MSENLYPKPSPAKIEPTTLHQQVAGRIRDMIRTGALVTGQKISEKSLCNTLGVSRTPIRESLRMLHSEGLIDLVPHKGAFVSRPPMKEIRDMFEVMSVLEGTCARLAVEKMKPGQLQEIKALHQRLETHYDRGDHQAYLSANHDFHVFIQFLSGNPVLNDVINGLRQKILLYRHQQLYQPERFRKSIQEHRRLLEAFKAGDAAGAESLMKQHLVNQCEALVGLFPEMSEENNPGSAAPQGAP